MALTNSIFSAGNVNKTLLKTDIRTATLANKTFLSEVVKALANSGIVDGPSAPTAPTASGGTASGSGSSGGKMPTLAILPIPDMVEPGDLITSDFMNQILAKLSELDARLLALETVPSATGTLAITAFSPSGTVRVKDELRIFGRNFGISDGTLRAKFTVGSRTVDITAYKPGSNDSLLIIDVPSIPNLADGGEQVTLSMNNATSGDARQITILPTAMVFAGGLNLDFISVDPNPIEASKPAEFKFRIKSLANLAAVYSLAPDITGVDKPADWLAQAEFANDTRTAVITSLSLAPDEEKIFFLRLRSIPAVPAHTAFNVIVNAKNSTGNTQVTGTSGVRPFSVADTAETQDTSISLNLADSEIFPDASVGTVAGGKITLKSGGTAKITLQASFTLPGDYTLTTVLAGATNWAAGPLSSTLTAIPITQDNLNNPDKKTFRTLAFTVKPGAGANSGGKVVFKLQRGGAANGFSFPMELQFQS